MLTANSMNKAHQCFEARGTFSFQSQGYLRRGICPNSVMDLEKTETLNNKRVSQSCTHQKVRSFRARQ